MDQMPLFAPSSAEVLRARVAAVTSRKHRRARAKAAKVALQPGRVMLQLDIWGDPLPITCWVRARQCKPAPAPKRLSIAADVFSFAALGQRIAMGKGASDRSIHRIVTRENGVTRHVAIREQDTSEWAEKERQRRARQRPPRPPQGAKTKSKKLRELIGEDDET